MTCTGCKRLIQTFFVTVSFIKIVRISLLHPVSCKFLKIVNFQSNISVPVLQVAVFLLDNDHINDNVFR